MSVNPFTYGNPISDPKRFFGRSHEVEQVFSRLRNAAFESTSIVGERRIGKTSLLNYLAHPLVRQHYRLDPDNYLFVYADLQVVDSTTTPMRLWRWLLHQMAVACSDAQIKRIFEKSAQVQSIDNFTLEDVFDHLDAKDQHVVLLLDEFENVTGNPNFDSAFFYGLRSLSTHHHLALVTASRHELIELCHSEAIRSSPFFNIFANINLGPFTDKEARNLISESLDGTTIRFTENEINTIFGLADSSPYFLQVACSFLFDAYTRNLQPEERTTYLRQAFREEATPHLAFYWHHSDDSEKIVLAVLSMLEWQKTASGRICSMKQLQDLYAHPIQALNRLEKRCLLISKGDSFSLFNPLLGEWIRTEITEIGRDQQSFEEWLASHKSVAERLKDLPERTKQELGEILSPFKGEYRELFLNWIIQAKILLVAGQLIKGFLGTAWELPG